MTTYSCVVLYSFVILVLCLLKFGAHFVGLMFAVKDGKFTPCPSPGFWACESLAFTECSSVFSFVEIVQRKGWAVGEMRAEGGRASLRSQPCLL